MDTIRIFNLMMLAADHKIKLPSQSFQQHEMVSNSRFKIHSVGPSIINLDISAHILDAVFAS